MLVVSKHYLGGSEKWTSSPPCLKDSEKKMTTAVAAPLQWEKWVRYQSLVIGFLLSSALETGIGVGSARQAAALQGWLWVTCGWAAGAQKVSVGLCPLLLRFHLSVQREKWRQLWPSPIRKHLCWAESSPEGRQMSKSKLGWMKAMRTSCISTRGPCQLGLEGGMCCAGHKALVLSDQMAQITAHHAHCYKVSNIPSLFPQIWSDSLAGLSICK